MPEKYRPKPSPTCRGNIRPRLITVIIAFVALILLSGCDSNPAEAARFFIESELKGNDMNARSMLVSEQQDDYTGTEGGFGAKLAEMLGLEGPSPETDTVARILAGSLILKKVTGTKKRVVFEYSFDLDKVRNEFEERGIASTTLLDTAIREAFLGELETFTGTLTLVMGNGKWRVDLLDAGLEETEDAPDK